MNKALIYKTYVEDSLGVLIHIYNEILDYSPQYRKTTYKMSTTIPSWCESLENVSRNVSSFLGVNVSPELNYSISNVSWRQDFYIESTRFYNIDLNFSVEFLIYDEYYLVTINDNGVIFTTKFSETKDAIRILVLTEDLRIIFNDSIVQKIRESAQTKSNVFIYAPTYFVNTYLRIKLPFHPQRLYLQNVGWVKAVLDTIDSTIARLNYFLIGYVQNLIYDKDGAVDGNSNNYSCIVSKEYTPTNLTTNLLYNDIHKCE